MNLDGARNAQIEILKDIFHFSYMPDRGEGSQAYVDPDYDELVVTYGSPPFPSNSQNLPIEPLLSKRSPRAARARLASKRSKATDNIAIGISAKQGENNLRIIAFYQNHRLKQHPILRSLQSRFENEVDMVYTGRPRTFPAWHFDRKNPLQPGASIGHPSTTAGTLGCFVKHKVDGTLGVLSNNHVLANVNAAAIGDSILQPGPSDGGTNSDSIATLRDYAPILFAGLPNTVDCAWAALDGSRFITPSSIIDSARLHVSSIASTNPVTLMPLDTVIKIGRTTGYTQGEVTAVLTANLQVDMGSGLSARFDDVTEIESLADTRFSDGGDSGSIILRRDGAPGALLFAGSKTGGHRGKGITFANPLDIVLNALDLEIVI